MTGAAKAAMLASSVASASAKPQKPGPRCLAVMPRIASSHAPKLSRSIAVSPQPLFSGYHLPTINAIASFVFWTKRPEFRATGDPLGQKGDWVVMASWLLQLRSLLLLPADTQAHRTGEDEADRLRDRLVGLQEMQALATWLDRRPQLGREVFARGQPEVLGISTETGHEVDVDVIEFLWASLALFDDDSADADATSWYLPRWLDLYSIPDARTRILRLLA